MILHYVFIFLFAFFKSVSDTLADHFSVSIFSKWKANYWDKNKSWQFVKFLPLTSYRPDGWHLSNSLMILSVACAVCFKPFFNQWYFNIPIDISVILIIFNIFYNKLLKK